MAEKVEPRPLPEPISDEGLERWKHILLDQFGSVLARIERAEKDRDRTMEVLCRLAATDPSAPIILDGILRWESFVLPTSWGTTDQARRACQRIFGEAEAARLFPKEAAK